MFLMSFLAAAAMPTERCAALDVVPITTNVTEVVEAPNDTVFLERLGALHAYWRSQCLQSRRLASIAVVRQVARLLEIPGARMITAEILIDLGPNLTHAREEMNRAIPDQIRVEERNRRTYIGRPLLPPSYHIVLDSLRCVRRKMLTGRIDEALCGYIVESNADSDRARASVRE
jgi:hypothetical protein